MPPRPGSAPIDIAAIMGLDECDPVGAVLARDKNTAIILQTASPLSSECRPDQAPLPHEPGLPRDSGTLWFRSASKGPSFAPTGTVDDSRTLGRLGVSRRSEAISTIGQCLGTGFSRGDIVVTHQSGKIPGDFIMLITAYPLSDDDNIRIVIIRPIVNDSAAHWPQLFEHCNAFVTEPVIHYAEGHTPR